MKDVSYHILDIVRNSLHADAGLVEIDILENSHTGRFLLKIKDDGHGMPAGRVQIATDPFFTTSVTKKVGLGLPLLKQNAELTGGTCHIESEEHKGTTVEAVFNRNHIDMIPMGNLAMTFRMLIATNPEKDFVYRHRLDDGGFDLNTAEIRRELDGVNINTREVLDYLTSYIEDNLKALKK